MKDYCFVCRTNVTVEDIAREIFIEGIPVQEFKLCERHRSEVEVEVSDAKLKIASGILSDMRRVPRRMKSPNRITERDRKILKVAQREKMKIRTRRIEARRMQYFK